MSKHEFLNAFINDSSTVFERAEAEIIDPRHKAVSYNVNGNVELAADGISAFGLILSPTPDPLLKDAQVHILIKNIGLLEVSEPIAKGDPVTIGIGGLGKKAMPGDYIFAWAYTGVHNAGELVQVQISRSGVLA